MSAAVEVEAGQIRLVGRHPQHGHCFRRCHRAEAGQGGGGGIALAQQAEVGQAPDQRGDGVDGDVGRSAGDAVARPGAAASR